MAEAAYLLCMLTSLACAALLARGYAHSRARFLLWCAGCFACLAVNNALLFVDKVVYPDDVLNFAGVSFATWRAVAALAGMALLLFGLICAIPTVIVAGPIFGNWIAKRVPVPVPALLEREPVESIRDELRGLIARKMDLSV